MPWFWQGELGGGGVLNDMMCHSVEVARLLLTDPAKPRDSVKPVKVSATIASLKWSRPEYADLLRQMMGNEVDYREAFGRLRARYDPLHRRRRRAADRRGHDFVELRRRGPEVALRVARPGILAVDQLAGHQPQALPEPPCPRLVRRRPG